MPNPNISNSLSIFLVEQEKHPVFVHSEISVNFPSTIFNKYYDLSF